ncbi:MAG: hypothetical protein NC131_20265, partial [Roseburia sp.]|nr:hypothetical protein [Roseburia sp.]
GKGTGGAGVFLVENSTFTLNAGKIYENTAQQNGGGVYVRTAESSALIPTFIMNGGEIYDNMAENGYGGGICGAGNVTITAGKIYGNINTPAVGSEYGGGGLSTHVGGTYSINCEIYGNSTANKGGGILLNGGAEISGTITGNDGKEGGGIYIACDGVKISGDAVIDDNFADAEKSIKSNVVFSGNERKLGVENLSGNASVGITPCGDSHILVNNLQDGAEAYFKSDIEIGAEFHFCVYNKNLVYGKHGGGAATCKDKAVCSVCSDSYGELSSTHDYGEGSWSWTNFTAATYTVTCSVCEREDDLNAVITSEITKAATCTEKGVRTYTAKVSVNSTEVTDSKTEDIGVISHSLSFSAGYAATCEEDGEAAHYTCALCGKYFKDENANEEISDITVAATGHDYGTEFISNGDNTHSRVCSKNSSHKTDTEPCSGGTATCSALAACEKCSAEYGTTNNNHKWKDEWISDGENGHVHLCEYNGAHRSEREAHVPDRAEATEEHAVVCTQCGYVIEPELSHVHSLTFVEGVEAGCLTDGQKSYYICTCGKWFEDENAEALIENHSSVTIPALGHNLRHHAAQAATCEEAGWSEFDECLRCDYTTYQEIEAIGHDFGDWIVTKAATCSGKGERTKYCANDAEHRQTEEIAIDPDAHNLTSYPAKSATCEEVGWNAYEECSLCGYSTRAEIAATGHSWSDYTVTKEATCTQKGSKERSCSVCGERETAEIGIASDAHSWDDGVVTKKATCSETGEKTFTCKHDERHTYTESIAVDANAHSWGEWKTVENATCLAEGRQERVCADSEEHKQQKAVPALGHDAIGHGAQAATCESVGWDEYSTCSRCDYSTYSEIPALGHRAADTLTKDEDGHWRECLNACGEKLDYHTHAFGEWTEVKKPTTTEEGLEERTCACGEKQSRVLHRAEQPSGDGKSNAGLIVGLTVGGAALVAAGIVVALIIVRKNKANKEKKK